MASVEAFATRTDCVERNEPITAVVTDCHLSRARIADVLSEAGLEMAYVASDAKALLAEMNGGPLDIAVLFVTNPGTSHLEAIKLLREQVSNLRVVLILASGDARSVRRSVKGHASGVILAENLERALEATVRAVHAGQVAVPAEASALVEPTALSYREKQILGLVVMGFTNAEIASKLYLAESTVKSHLSSAFDKLGVRSRSEAARLILDPSEGLGIGILAISGESAPPHLSH